MASLQPLQLEQMLPRTQPALESEEDPKTSVTSHAPQTSCPEARVVPQWLLVPPGYPLPDTGHLFLIPEGSVAHLLPFLAPQARHDAVSPCTPGPFPSHGRPGSAAPCPVPRRALCPPAQTAALWQHPGPLDAPVLSRAPRNHPVLRTGSVAATERQQAFFLGTKGPSQAYCRNKAQSNVAFSPKRLLCKEEGLSKPA